MNRRKVNTFEVYVAMGCILGFFVAFKRTAGGRINGAPFGGRWVALGKNHLDHKSLRLLLQDKGAYTLCITPHY
jgi:hypothetical protein